jgi:hypothetical protein
LRIREFPNRAAVLEPNGGKRVKSLRLNVLVECVAILARVPHPQLALIHPTSRQIMVITAAEISPIVALIAGILILIIPRLLNIIVAVYLIVEGLVGLNAVHHFLR